MPMIALLLALAAAPPSPAATPSPPPPPRPAPAQAPVGKTPKLKGGPPPVDPLAPARQGRLQCHRPDIARRSCQILTRYRFGADGQVWSESQAALKAQPLVIMQSSIPVAVKDGAICGDSANMTVTGVTIDGKPGTAEELETLRAQLHAILEPEFGQLLCSRYSPDGDTLRGDVTLNGAPRPELTRKVMWIDADSGFTVAVTALP